MSFQRSRRSFLGTLAGATTALALPLPGLAWAEVFPDKSKPIRGIVPGSPGTTADTVARAYSQAMTDILGTSVVIEDRPGGQDLIGVGAVKSAPPDGYTIMFTSLSTMVINPHLFKKLPYDPMKDFVPLAATMKTSLFLNVGTSVSQKTAKELLAAAKANPKKFTYGSVSATTRLAGEMIGKAAGAEFLNVPYKNISDLMTNLVAGKLDIFIADAAAVAPYFNQGVRPLAVTGKTRHPLYPEVPTLEEQGLAGFELIGWHATYAPANTPQAAVATLRDAIRKASQSKPVKEYFKTFGMEPFDIAGDELGTYQKNEFDRWGKAVADAGMTGSM